MIAGCATLPENYDRSESTPSIDIKSVYGINSPYILFVGERRPHKNIENSIKAFKLVKNQLQNNIKLVIIGKKYSNYVAPENVIMIIRNK